MLIAGDAGVCKTWVLSEAELGYTGRGWLRCETDKIPGVWNPALTPLTHAAAGLAPDTGSPIMARAMSPAAIKESSPPAHSIPPRDVPGADAEDLAPYREKFRCRVPESLDELHGPTHGVVDLPLHMAWSGMTSFDMSKPRQRTGLYRTVLHERLRDDLPCYLDRDLLLHSLRPGRRLPPAHLPHPGSRMTDMPELHTRLRADVIALGSPYPLVLTGGYAVRAHRLVNRPSQDLDVATENPAPWPTSPPRSASAWKPAAGRCTHWRRHRCPPASP